MTLIIPSAFPEYLLNFHSREALKRGMVRKRADTSRSELDEIIRGALVSLAPALRRAYRWDFAPHFRGFSDDYCHQQPEVFIPLAWCRRHAMLPVATSRPVAAWNTHTSLDWTGRTAARLRRSTVAQQRSLAMENRGSLPGPPILAGGRFNHDSQPSWR